jgi:hypothetical protein
VTRRALACLVLSATVAGCGRPSQGNPARSEARPTALAPQVVATPSAGASGSVGPEDAGSNLEDAGQGTSAPNAPPVADAIDAVIMADPEFRAYVCREDPCSLTVLHERLDYERVYLRDAPPVVGYVVSLGDQAPQQGYFALFKQTGPTTVVRTLQYFGTGLVVEDKTHDHGYRRVRGQYRDSATEWGEDEYAWNGNRYAKVAHRVHKELAP